jgi:hypothetical protein
MRIYRFPGPADMATESILDPNQRLAVGPVSFTCTACNVTNTADFSNMVFRSLDFYCLNCGSPFRMVNPAFSGSRFKK